MYKKYTFYKEHEQRPQYRQTCKEAKVYTDASRCFEKKKKNRKSENLEQG